MVPVGDQPLLVFADDWGRHPSSCQHLIRRLREDRPILWVNTVGTRQVRADSFTLRRGLEKIKNWSQGIQQVHERMWVVDLPMLPALGRPLFRKINRTLVTLRLKRVLKSLKLSHPVVLTTLPYMGWLIRGLPRRGLIYYCTDDYSHWPSADRETLQHAEEELRQEADLVLAASNALVQRHAKARRCHYFPHGVDVAHFASTQTAPVAPEVAGLPGPRIGFFGLIYEKLNFDLLAQVARRFQNGSLVLIGPVAKCPPEFADIPNVRMLGPKPYHELPTYLAGLDVLLLPYVDDPMIRQSGPLKLRECLASGKPTVSIDVPEVRLLQPHVRVAANPESFQGAIADAVAQNGHPDPIRARQLAVAHDDWDQRANQLRTYLKEFQSASIDGTAIHAPQSTKRRIMHLRTVSGKGGGPEKTILNSPRFLCERYEMRIVYVRPVDDAAYDLPERAKELAVDFADIPERGPLDPRSLWRLIQEVRTFRPDILHAHDYKTNALAALVGRWLRIPVMTTAHGYGVRGGRLQWYYRLDRWVLPWMDHTIAVSPDLFQYFVEDMRLAAERCSLIENGIDTVAYQRTLSPQQAKAKLGTRSERFVIGAVGRLSPEKGFDLLIRAVDQLLHQGRDIELWIIGAGDQQAELERLINQLGHAERIRLFGHRTDLLDIYQAMDVYVLSSLREGLPNVVLEAMALEVPVIATRVAGLPRLIDDGQNGLLMEPGNVNEITGAISRVMDNPSLGQQLAAAGRRTIEERYSFAVRMAKVEAIYDRLLGRIRSEPGAGLTRSQPEIIHEGAICGAS